MYLVVEEQSFPYSRVNLLLLFISKLQDMKAHDMSDQQVRSWSYALWVTN